MDSNFLYSGLDKDTSALALELESLGGGDATLGRFDVHAVVDDRLDPNEKSSAKVLWVHGKTIGIRDAFLPKSAPSSDIMTYASLSSTSKFSTFVQNPSKSPLNPKGIVEWVLDGFNACVLSYGGRNVGKSLAFYGPEQRPVLADPIVPGNVASQEQNNSVSLVSILLRNIYELAGLPRSASSSIKPTLNSRLKNNLKSVDASFADNQHEGRSGTTVGISCWAVRASGVVDLCKVQATESYAPSDKNKERDYCVIECQSLDAALSVVAAARARCPGVHTMGRPTKGNKMFVQSEAQRAHFFLRVIVHREGVRDLSRSSSLSPQEPASLLSHLHVVDLLGIASPEADPQFSRLSESDRIARREHALQMQAFARILGQMRNTANAAAKQPTNVDPRDAVIPTITSGRDSLLTSILAPIIQGNCRTVLVTFLKDGEEHYRTSKATLMVCDGLGHLLQPCHRVSGVPKAALNMRSVDSLLPPYVPLIHHGDTRKQHHANESITSFDNNEELLDGIRSVHALAERNSLDDSILEYRQLDLAAVAAGAVDHGSPVRPSEQLGRLTEAFEMELAQHKRLPAEPPHARVQFADPERSNTNYIAHSQFAVSNTHTTAVEPIVQTKPEAVYNNVRISDQLPDPPEEVLEMQNSAPIITKGTTVADSISKPHSHPEPQSPLRTSSSEYALNSPILMSPLPASRTLISLALDCAPEANRDKQPDLAPSNINFSYAAAHAIANSELLLKAKASKDRVAANTDDAKSRKRIKVMKNFREQVENIYRLYNPEKLNSVSDILEKFKGREIVLLEELERKYNILDAHLLGYSDGELVSVEACVVYKHGCFIRDVPSRDAATLGELNAGAIVTLSGRSYHPPLDGEVTYAELCKTSTTPRGGWLTIVAHAGGRVLDIPGYNYDRMCFNGSRTSSPVDDFLEGVGSLSGSDSSMRKAVYQLSLSLKDNTPQKISPTKSPAISAVPKKNSGTKGERSSPSPKRHSPLPAQCQAVSNKKPSMLSASANRESSPLKGAPEMAEKIRSAPLPSFPTGIQQPDKTGPLALSEAGVRALTLARTAALESAESSPFRNMSPKQVNLSTSSDSKDLSFAAVVDASFQSAGEFTVTGEVEALRRNTATLMEALNFERESREKAQAELRVAIVEAQEKSSILELAREDHQLALRRVQGQVKAAMSDRGYGAVFQVYEEDMDRAQSELDLLRRRNLMLESNDFAVTDGADVEKRTLDSVNSSFMEAALRGNKLSGKMRKLQHENESLIQEMADLRKQKRQFLLGLKITQESGDRLKEAIKENKLLREEITDAQRAVVAAQENYANLREDFQTRSQTDAQRADEHEALLREVQMLRARVKEVDAERWRQAQVDALSAPGVGANIPDMLPIEGGSAAGAGRLQTNVPSYAQPTTSSRTGRSDEYPPAAGAPALEQALSELHSGLMTQAPSLLPLLRRVGNCIYYERTRYIKQRADLLSVVYPLDHETQTSSSETDLPTHRMIAVEDKEAIRSINARRNFNVDVGAHYSSAGSQKPNKHFASNSNSYTGSSQFQANSGGIDTSAALSALRKHRKAVRDAQLLGSQPYRS